MSSQCEKESNIYMKHDQQKYVKNNRTNMLEQECYMMWAGSVRSVPSLDQPQLGFFFGDTRHKYKTAGNYGLSSGQTKSTSILKQMQVKQVRSGSKTKNYRKDSYRLHA